MIAPLLKAGVIIDRSERNAGRLMVADPNRIKSILGLRREAPRVPAPDQIEVQA